MELDWLESSAPKVEFEGFYVLELGELAVHDDRADQLKGLLEPVPHALVLRARSGQVKTLVPNVLCVRPRVKELPFTVSPVFDFGQRRGAPSQVIDSIGEFPGHLGSILVASCGETLVSKTKFGE